MPEARGTYPNNNSREELVELKARLLAFRARYFDKELPSIDKPCTGRLGDIMHPLFAVAQLLPPEAREGLVLLVEEFEGERKQSEAETLAGRIVEALHALQGEISQGQILVERVTEKVNEGIEERWHVSSLRIGRELSALGIDRRKSHGKMAIQWKPKLLGKIFKRYLPANILPNLPSLPNVELEGASAGEEAIRISPPATPRVVKHRDNGEVGEVISPPQKNLFPPIPVEEVFE
jgi:hypothetical protein